MRSEFSRRHFLQGTAAAAAAAGYMQIDPDFFISKAHAQAGKTLTFLSAENITGNWDPTAHTTLSQKNIEGFVMGFLSRTPMKLDKPDEVVYELATEIKLLDPNRLQIKLRQGVTFHDGKPFKAEDVKATFEYGSRADRPAQWYPGPTETLKIETPDDYTVIVDTSKGGYPAHLFIFLASFLPMMSAKDIAAGPGGVLSQRLNGTGPFKFVEQRGNATVMAANDSYFKGKPVILYFYPKDDTPGCTREACAFRDQQKDLRKLGAVVLGVSADDVDSHGKFRDKYQLNFPLLADMDHQVAEKYGAWREKNMYGKKSMGVQRSTFLIDAQGVVVKVWKKVQVDGHDQQVIDALKELP